MVILFSTHRVPPPFSFLSKSKYFMEIVVDDSDDITRVWYKFDQFDEIQNSMVITPFALKPKAPIISFRQIKKTMGFFLQNNSMAFLDFF